MVFARPGATSRADLQPIYIHIHARYHLRVQQFVFVFRPAKLYHALAGRVAGWEFVRIDDADNHWFGRRAAQQLAPNSFQSRSVLRHGLVDRVLYPIRSQ